MIKHQHMKFGWLGVVFATTLWALSVNAAADPQGEGTTANANMVESIDYSTLPGGKVVVKVTLKQEQSQPPAAFTTNAPPRVALDFQSSS